MTPDPDQVDVHHHVTAHIIGKEMEAKVTIKRQQRQGHGQNRERSDNQDVGAKRSPGKYRHFEQVHARRTHLQNGHEEVDTGQRGPDTGKLETPDPVIDPDARTVLRA